MSYDFLETADDDAMQQAKRDFGDFVVGIENRLDQAETYGKAGDIRMLTVLLELQDVQSDLETLAKNAHEEMPSKNYHMEVTKIIRTYIAGIIEKEYESLQKSISEKSESPQNITSRINQLLHITSFYQELYPELELAHWGEKVRSLVQ